MTDVTPTRIGQVNAGGSVDTLFLKVFAGEVLTAFEQNTVMMDKHTIRTIPYGKSASFPRLGRIAPDYHVPGQFLGTTTAINANEAVITVDGIMKAHQWVPAIDDLKNHYDVRGPITTEIGRGLANQFDKHVLQMGVLAARAATFITDLPGGTVIDRTDMAGKFGGVAGDYTVKTAADDLEKAIRFAAQKMDENDVPVNDRYVFLPQSQYYLLLDSNKLISSEYSAGNGNFAQATIKEIHGFRVVRTNNFPTTNITTGVEAGGTGAKYAGDFSDTAALCMHPSAVGTLKVKDLTSVVKWMDENLAWLLMGWQAVGHGTLRPEAAVEISDAVGS